MKLMESLNNVSSHQAGPNQNETINMGERLQDQMEVVEDKFSIMSNLMIICLMLRFLHTVHSLRLFPGVGFFIITTKKMAKHLLQFAIVFIIVAMSFATIFYFVMRQETCPALKVEGFESLATSLFSTYQVALGYGEYKFTNNLNARIAYMSYTIMTIVLLLNLVIAVMTTTAEEPEPECRGGRPSVVWSSGMRFLGVEGYCEDTQGTSTTPLQITQGVFQSRMSENWTSVE